MAEARFLKAGGILPVGRRRNRNAFRRSTVPPETEHPLTEVSAYYYLSLQIDGTVEQEAVRHCEAES